ncbi:MAG: TonB-dependent receptor [Candidatus Methylopumilus sp.]|nr:TonB-dependent receptor [Candidatus Methylopumilus sp.]
MQHLTYRLGAAAAALAVSTSALAQTLPSNLATTATSTVSVQATRESSVAELKLGPTPQLATIVVTPGRTAEALSDTLGDNSVIGREELDTLPNGTLADALAREHGIEALNYGGPQPLSSVNIRGTNSNQSLILIDGLRINSATTGDAPLGAIPLNSIERVEIVRGTASSLYGADAIGGVINIITRGDQDRPFSAYANTGVGSYGTTQYDAGLSGAADGWVYSLFGGYGQSGGTNATKPGNYSYNPDKDSYYRSNVGGTLGYTWKPGQTLTFQSYQSSVNGGYDAGTPDFNDRGIQTVSTNMLTSKNRISDFWTSTLRAGYTNERYQTVNAGSDLVPNNPLDGKQHFATRQGQYLWQNDLKFSPTQIVSLGYERLEQSVDGTLSNGGYPQAAFVNYQQTTRYTNSLFGIYRGAWGPQSVQASVRNDNNSQYGNFVTGSLVYGLSLTPQWRATVGANTGFRAPNFNELYWPVTPFYAGNPFLQPEKSRNIELGLKYSTEKTQLSLVAYRNEITNLILTQPVVPGDIYSPYAPINVGQALIQGVSLFGSHRFNSDTQVRGSLNWLDPRNAETGALLPQRAQQVAKLALDQALWRARLTAEWYVSSERKDTMSGGTLGGYSLLNLQGSYPLPSGAEVQVRWNNVFGKQYTLIQGYSTLGSNVFVNLAWRM